MLCLGGFLDAPSACPLIDTLIFWLEKSIEVVHVFHLEVSFVSDLHFGSSKCAPPFFVINDKIYLQK